VRTTTRVVEVRTFASEVRPDVTSEREVDGEVIAWADAHPQAYKIVTSSKSKAFGLGSTSYLGCDQRGDSPEVIVARLARLRTYAEGQDGASGGGVSDVFTWSARFTLERFGDRGFTGGFLQEHCVHTDGREYPRHCLTLDHTPETLQEVIDRFVAWADAGPSRYPGRRRVTLDGALVRTFGGQGVEPQVAATDPEEEQEEEEEQDG
jgi:hypothetical protein